MHCSAAWAQVATRKECLPSIVGPPGMRVLYAPQPCSLTGGLAIVSLWERLLVCYGITKLPIQTRKYLFRSFLRFGQCQALRSQDTQPPLTPSWTTGVECRTPARSTSPNSCSTGPALWEFFRKSAALQGKRPWRTGEKVGKTQILLILP